MKHPKMRFVWLLFHVSLKNSPLMCRRHNCPRKGLQNLGQCLRLRPFGREGSLSCQNLQWNGTSFPWGGGGGGWSQPMDQPIMTNNGYLGPTLTGVPLCKHLIQTITPDGEQGLPVLVNPYFIWIFIQTI